MATTTITTELPGNVQVAAIGLAEIGLEIKGERSGLGLTAAVQLIGDIAWIYNSVSGGTVDMPVAAGQALAVVIPFGLPITAYAKAAGAGNLYVYTVN